MPAKNRFRHQPYHAASPVVSFEVLDDPQPVHPSAPDFHDRLIAACEPYQNANLAAVYLIHGTFAGNDALGTLTELQRFAPGLAERLRGIFKGVFDTIAGETGNYTTRFSAAFAHGLKGATKREIPVERFHWSSQNNHIGRADGAVRLIAKLATLAENQSDRELASSTPTRVLLWAHSHGGNVLALVTNLLAADPAARKAFFDAARVFYVPWIGANPDMPVWHHVEQLLEIDHPVRRLQLDIATFGTPIRYGWDSGGYSKLLHIVNHRVTHHLPRHRTHHPLRPIPLLSAMHGDYIHQLGIAGTNLVPVPLAVRSFLADRRLHDVLQSDVPWIHLLNNFTHGQRVPQEGHTLLVDYDDDSWRFWHHLAGHAAYTRRHWLPFHLTQVAERFYRTGNKR